jgi:hypothetical protein
MLIQIYVVHIGATLGTERAGAPVLTCSRVDLQFLFLVQVGFSLPPRDRQQERPSSS